MCYQQPSAKKNQWIKCHMFILLITGITYVLSAQGVTKNGQIKDTSDIFVNENGRIGSDRKLDKNGQLLFTVRDVDGNVYNVVTIGTQVWMKENLKVTSYSNGDIINTTSPDTLNISSEIAPKYQWVYNDIDSSVIVYGRLYTWYAVSDSRNLCPFGWHVPTDSEWSILTEYLLGEGVAGDKIKETGTAHWMGLNTSATNETSFTGRPGGFRFINNIFYLMGQYGCWWSASECNAGSAFYRYLYCNYSYFYRCYNGKSLGYSVRCLQN